MAHARADTWWLPALYLQRGEFEPVGRREQTWQRGLDAARAQSSRSLEQRILRTLSRTLTERPAS
jgi:hypothetical protein